MARFEIKNGVAIIPDGTTEIPLTAFRECPSLKTINVPSDYVDYYKEVLPEEFKPLVVGFINDENS